MVPDRQEVQALQAAYTYLMDTQQGQALAEIFTEDGRLIVPGRPPVVGRAGLAQFVVSARPGVHVPGQSHNGADGTVFTPFVFIGGDNGGVVSGYYRDSFVRSADGTCLIAERDIEIKGRS